MSEGEKVGSVEYRPVEPGYFEKRQLKPYARAFHLWALGVGAVISGDFYGWNFGLPAGGFGGLLLATGIVTVLYLGLSYSIAEMSPALPHTGGAYSFARSAMGPWGGYVTGLGENLEYILTPAVIVVGSGAYLGAVFQTPEEYAPLWWLGAYVVFVALNVWGVKLAFRFAIAITLLALAVLVVFFVGAVPHTDLDAHALDIEPAEGGSRFLPMGWFGVFAALPFAIWFYLGIEELPLAAEESHDPRRDMPRGILLGIGTLIVLAFLTLFLNSAISPGAAEVGASQNPLYLAFQTIFGDGLVAKLLALVAVAGLVASFHTIMFAYGRQIYSLSRAGYFPRFLSITHPRHKTPHVALIAGGVLGYAVALAIHYGPEGVPVGAVLLNMAVFGAVISYVLQMLSFILLRIRRPGIERPYRSPLGIPGAAMALAISALTLVFLFLNADYRYGVVGAAVWYGLGLVYFAAWGRRRLVKSPEEAFALRD
ncbi:MAG: ethanolamine permease [Planctomycetes bacterium]|nr:ethanolamine permease [Planctomycetota bacterium]